MLQVSRFAKFDELISSASKSLQRLKELYMDKYHLSAAHTNCLCCMVEHPEGLMQQELVKMLSMDKAQVSRVLRAMIERGYVSCNALSGYKKRYRLTEAGATAASELQKTILNINRFVSDEIGDEEIETFYRIFGKIAQNLKNAIVLTMENDEKPFQAAEDAQSK